MQGRVKIAPQESQLSELDLANYEEKQDYQHTIVPLKRTEVWAWYIQNATYCGYGWLAAPLMVPLLIQDMASKAGVEVSNHAIPCNTSVPNFKCVTPILGRYFLDPGAISLYISSLSSVLSFFMSLSIAAVADHGCCINTLLFFIIQSPKLFWVGAILSPLGWVFYNICSVFSHSYLPVYGRVHPDVLEAEARGDSEEVIRKVEEQAVNDLSSYASAIANIGSILIHGACIWISLGMKESSLSLEIATAVTGVWWLMWMLIVAPWLDARPGPPMPKEKNWIVYSWKKTYNTLLSFKTLPEIFKFMVAWFILSDGIGTVLAIIMVILYRELGFTHVQSLLVSVVISVMACIGAYLFMYIRRYFQWTTKVMIVLTLSFYAILVSYLVLAPYFTKSFGLRHPWEGWFCTVYIGIIISTFYSSCRVMLSELCPEGDENEWFSLYLLADKGSSWMGPFITGAIFTANGDYRAAFWFPLGLIVIGVIILANVDMKQGKDQAQAFARAKRERLLLESSSKMKELSSHTHRNS
ncbi:MFS transporter, UMF1 family [Entomortierella parvispora]|uniref:Autophagy-related protein n=1 Tax=Entomortierella parvispora TaxID=205924 RepID=A0A9P3HM61_9FUNG|nr:MFS transporter, UMF1 family [Entomortierella parvispora]